MSNLPSSGTSFTDALAFLFTNADDHEADSLTRLLLRTGYLWECGACGYRNVHDDEGCDGCGADRTSICRHCQRSITLTDDGWIDPEATGDDSIWREVCDRHDTFDAKHEPEEPSVTP